MPRGRCLRSDSRATAIVTAAARIVRPTSWPPMSRTLSGSPAETSRASIERAFGSEAGAGLGEGSTVGNPELASPVGLGRPGNDADGIAPGGRAPGGIPPGGKVPGGKVPGGRAPGGRVPPSPTPGPVGVGSGDGDGEDFALACTWTVAEAEVDAFLVSLEVSVAVSVRRVFAAFLGIAIRACNSVWLVPTPTEHVALPVAGHTVKAGENRRGFAASEIFALALPVVTQTKIAYRAWLPGWTTLPLRDCTEMHSWPFGGGVDDFVGVGVVEGVGVPVWFGDGCGDLSGDGELVGLPLGDVLGLAFDDVLGLAEPIGEPGLTEGLGCGEGDVLAFAVGDGLADLLAAGLADLLAAGLAVLLAAGLALPPGLPALCTTRAVRWICDPPVPVGSPIAAVPLPAHGFEACTGPPGLLARNMLSRPVEKTEIPASKPTELDWLRRTVMGGYSSARPPDLGKPAARVSAVASLVSLLHQVSRHPTTAFPTSTIRHLSATQGDQRKAMSRASKGKTSPSGRIARG